MKSVAGTDTLASFVVIDRDSVHEISYQFKKISGQHKGFLSDWKNTIMEQECSILKLGYGIT